MKRGQSLALHQVPNDASLIPFSPGYFMKYGCCENKANKVILKNYERWLVVA